MNYLLKTVHKLITSIVVCLLVMCCNKQAVPVINEPVQQVSSDVIKLRLENQAQTKMSINSLTGAATWSTGDQVAYCVSNNTTTKYIVETVNTSTCDIPASSESGYTRCNYAIYPASCRGSNFTTPTVVYPSSYNLDGIVNLETFSPAPMVALNQPGEALTFYHVGGLLRLYMYNIPTKTRKIRVLFNNKDYVTGTYSVSNAGTTDAYTTVLSGSTNYVDFIKSSDFPSEMYINVPLPSGDYSSCGEIIITPYAANGDYLINKTKFIGWSSVPRAKGKQMNADLTTDPLPIIADLSVLPVPLYYDGTSFLIKDEVDVANSFNQYYGLVAGSYYFNCSNLQNFNSLSWHGYSDWRLMTYDDARRLTSYNGSTISTSGTFGRPGATIQHSGGAMYNKHLMRARFTGPNGQGRNYVGGVIVFPDNVTIDFGSINLSSYSRAFDDCSENGAVIDFYYSYGSCYDPDMLSKLKQQGCIFFPALGNYYSGGWSLFDTYAQYIGSNSQLAFSLSTGTYSWWTPARSWPGSNPDTFYDPVRLVRDAD